MNTRYPKPRQQIEEIYSNKTYPGGIIGGNGGGIPGTLFSPCNGVGISGKTPDFIV